MSEDHAKVTATVNEHPFTGLHTASIHPCKHAETMKAMIDRATEGGGTVKVEQYFFIFMKFVSSIVPTLDLESTSLNFIC
jgi:ubiquitin-like-conjugating enzyme ATG3